MSKARKDHGPLSREAAALNYQLEVLTIQVKDREKENRERNRTIRRFVFERVASADGQSHRLHWPGGCLPARKRRQPLAHPPHQPRRAEPQGRRRCRRHDSRRIAVLQHPEIFLGHVRHAAVHRHRHLAGGLHGGDLHRQGDGRQDQAEDRPEPGADRPGAGQSRRRGEPVLSPCPARSPARR
ncbi:MAG: hypothetical protein M5R42_07860 [Rhodocyclaceae bacterium]|nr:hypothetical protein [Rhodocyclaceae bacterium]